jgi:hypothetical protein
MSDPPLALKEAFRAWLGNAAFPWAEQLNVSYASCQGKV